MDYSKRITSDNINALGPTDIFVFGSNLSGRHGAGAARTALKWGAKYGQAEGLQGKTYALPTVAHNISRTLSVDEIRPHADKFIEFAKSRPDLIFLLTEIGCGLAGHKIKDIAPLFEKAITTQNIHMPAKFWRKLLSLE